MLIKIKKRLIVVQILANLLSLLACYFFYYTFISVVITVSIFVYLAKIKAFG
jgi:hypothetical protein